jgi:hypothetical protein
MNPANRTHLRLETLNDRVVPATLNLTTAGAEGTLNGAIYTQLAPDANGDDPTDTFLTLQERTFLGSLFTPEEGYNTDARPLQFDAIGGPDQTRALQLNEAPVIMREGVAYREFLLTVRQRTFAPNINLDELRIFVGTTGTVTGYNTNTDLLAGMSPVYNLDAGTNNTVRVNDNLNTSPTADVAVLIPESVFAGANSDSFVYLYSKFSTLPGISVLSGAEAWSVREVDEPPPPTGNLSLSGFVYRVAGDWDPGANEGGGTLLGGLGGVQIFLLDEFGANVLDQNEQPVFTTTASDGSFSFTGLSAGTYGLSQVLDEGGEGWEGIVDGVNFVGNSGGQSIEDNDDMFLGIVLVENVNGVDYIFTEQNNE